MQTFKKHINASRCSQGLQIATLSEFICCQLQTVAWHFWSRGVPLWVPRGDESEKTERSILSPYSSTPPASTAEVPVTSKTLLWGSSSQRDLTCACSSKSSKHSKKERDGRKHQRGTAEDWIGMKIKAAATVTPFPVGAQVQCKEWSHETSGPIHSSCNPAVTIGWEVKWENHEKIAVVHRRCL